MKCVFHVKHSMLWRAVLLGAAMQACLFCFENADGYTANCGDVVWRIRLGMTDFTGKDAGWFDVSVSSQSGVVVLPNGMKRPYSFRAEIMSDTALPFWLFTGKSKTREVEYLDSRYMPVFSELEIVTPKDRVLATTWIEEDGSGEKLRIRLVAGSGKTRERKLDMHERTLTASNIPFIVKAAMEQNGKPLQCRMLNKASMEMKKITFKAEPFDGRPEAAQYAGDSQTEITKLSIDLHVIGGTAVFYVDKDVNPYYGEGVGVKAVSLRIDTQ